MKFTRRFGWLAASALLLACGIFLSDLYAEVATLRGGVQEAQMHRAKELATVQNTDWMRDLAHSRSVQLQWLTRMIESQTPGLMRVNSIEHLKTLCGETKAASCEVSLQPDDTRSAVPAQGATRGRAEVALPAGVRIVKAKLAFNFSPEVLARLLDRIESGQRLGRVDHLQVAGARAELELSLFGVDASEAGAIRAARQIGERQ